MVKRYNIKGSEAQSRKRRRSGALPSPCENHTTPRCVSQAFCMQQRFSGLTLQTSGLEPASLCGGSVSQQCVCAQRLSTK